MPLDRKDIEAALLKKGFQSDERDHHFFIYQTQTGEITSVFTKTSHGSKYKTLSDKLVSKMASQCGLATKQFKELVACPLSRADYEAILIQAGRISSRAMQR